MRLTIRSRIEEARAGRGEDRVAVLESNGRKTVVVADGAGGLSGGATAADALCRAAIAAADWSPWLAAQDTALAAARHTGLAAATVLSITDDGVIHGASVGDCEAWLFARGESVNLTEHQARKPLLGDGSAVPVSFTARAADGTIVVATDGLWKYMKRERIAEAAALRPLETALDALVAGVRLRSGVLQDDVAIVLIEVSPS